MNRTLFLTLFALLLSLPGAALAEGSPAEISRRSRERGTLNLVGLGAKLKLVTESKDGRKKKEQVLDTVSKKIDGRTHTIARFVTPASVSGVAVLTVEKQGGEGSDMSLYLPKLRRVRKVAASQRGQAFFDTDFNYADLGGSGAVPDDEVDRKEDAKVDGREAWVLTGKPGDDSPYGRVTIWVDKQTYVPLRAEYEDKAGKPLKTYRTLELKKFKDRVLAAESVMENVQTGSKTRMSLLEVRDVKLGDEAFSDRALERG